MRKALAKPRSTLVRTVRPDRGLVLQSFEVDDVGVDGDTDGHDEADHAGQVDGGVEALAHAGDDRPQQAAGDGQAGHHHQAEEAVVEDDVEHDQGQPGQAGDQPGLQRRLAQRRRDGLDGEPVELDRQGAVGELGGQGLGLVLGEAARDLHLAVERGEGRLGGLGDGRRDDLAVEVDADDGVELLLGQRVPRPWPRRR